MTPPPESIVILVGLDKQVVILFDAESSATLTVVSEDERITSWWSGRESAERARAEYQSAGMQPSAEALHPDLKSVICRRWDNLGHARNDYPKD